jgi:hypothetical protein
MKDTKKGLRLQEQEDLSGRMHKNRSRYFAEVKSGTSMAEL